MNKQGNILMLLVILPALMVSAWIAYDLQIKFLDTTGEQLQNKTMIFTVFATLLAMIGARRALKRWMGVYILSKQDRFTWSAPISKTRRTQSVFYLLLEATMMCIFAVFFYRATSYALPITIVLVIIASEHILLAMMSFTGKYRVGITSKAIISSDREAKVIYLNGLQKVSTQQKTIYFDFPTEIQHTLSTELLEKSDLSAFKTAFESLVDRDKVYFEESFKNL
jgi:hypothetical protein